MGSACWSPPWRPVIKWIRHLRREGRDGFAMTIGVTARVYREIEAGDRTPSLDTYRRISELHGWPQTFVWER
jgi:DNA-binding XRE family transcriptional regulator